MAWNRLKFISLSYKTPRRQHSRADTVAPPPWESQAISILFLCHPQLEAFVSHAKIAAPTPAIATAFDSVERGEEEEVENMPLSSEGMTQIFHSRSSWMKSTFSPSTRETWKLRLYWAALSRVKTQEYYYQREWWEWTPRNNQQSFS